MEYGRPHPIGQPLSVVGESVRAIGMVAVSDVDFGAALVARYRKIDPRIWNDEKFRLLGDDGQLIFFFLLTHPNQTAIGAMRGTIGGLADEKNWPIKRFQKPFEQIVANGMAVYDDVAACIWLPKFVKYNEPESPNVVKGWARALDFIPECMLRRKAIIQAGHAVRELGGKKEGFKEAFAKVFPEEYAIAFMEGLSKDSTEHVAKHNAKHGGQVRPIREQRAESSDLSGKLPRGGVATGSKPPTGVLPS